MKQLMTGEQHSAMYYCVWGTNSCEFGLRSSVIVETDSTAIASRVSRPKADATEIVLNEQTIMNAYLTVREKVQQRIGQL